MSKKRVNQPEQHEAPKVNIRNPKNGIIKTISTGPLYLGIFCGPLVFLLYGMWVQATLNLLSLILVGFLLEGWKLWVVEFLVCWMFAARGNKMHIQHLIKRGWIPCTPNDAKLAGCVWRHEWEVIDTDTSSISAG